MVEEKRMPDIVSGGLAVAAIFLGVCFAVCPAWAISKSVDNDDRRPPTRGEIWFMRAVGVGVILIAVGGLHAILTGAPAPPGPPLP
jgi:hypothetical protein